MTCNKYFYPTIPNRSILFHVPVKKAEMATEDKELSAKLDSAMVITKEKTPEAAANEAEIYTSELRGSDESGEGTYKVPYKTILQAMRRHGKEPFPTIYQDPKPDSDAAKSGKYIIEVDCFEV